MRLKLPQACLESVNNVTTRTIIPTLAKKPLYYTIFEGALYALRQLA